MATAALAPTSAGTTPIKRAYNGRFMQNDSNHRYITTDALYAQMTAQGWSGEGTLFCAAQYPSSTGRGSGGPDRDNWRPS